MTVKILAFTNKIDGYKTWLTTFYMVTAHLVRTWHCDKINHSFLKDYIQQNTIVLAGVETTVCKHVTEKPSHKANVFMSCPGLLSWNLPTQESLSHNVLCTSHV